MTTLFALQARCAISFAPHPKFPVILNHGQTVTTGACAAILFKNGPYDDQTRFETGSGRFDGTADYYPFGAKVTLDNPGISVPTTCKVSLSINRATPT